MYTIKNNKHTNKKSSAIVVRMKALFFSMFASSAHVIVQSSF